MRIKKLEVVGFKSFLEKSTFYFNVPITSIVGPNGCGKSNVVDALKWVTGELSFKELRGRSMEDLIFAGSETRAPTSMTEVALTLDNSVGLAPPQYKDYAEITVVRRIFRDGTSEFFINKVACRLRDIIDLFLDTGIGQTSYSIIEQGRVGAIVSGRPEDRRMIIEEAAGITKYKHRKKAALRKMEFTKQNLLRVTDILAELKRQINSLERQARQAERFREARDRARELDIALAAKDHLAIEDQLELLTKAETDLADQWRSEDADLIAHEAGSEKMRLDLLEAEKTLEEAQKNLFQHASQIQSLETRIESYRREIIQLRETADTERRRVEALTEKRKEFESEAARLRADLFTHETTREQLEQELAEAVALGAGLQTNVQYVEERLNHEQKVHVDTVRKEAELLHQLAASEQRLEELNRQIEQRTKEHERVLQECQELERSYAAQKESLGKVVQLRFGFEQDQATVRTKLNETQAQLAQAAEELAQTNQQMEGQRSRLNALEEFTRTYQGYRKGVRTVMERKAQAQAPLGNILGLLGEMIRPVRGYERAVQAALSEWIECILVDSPADALKAIDFLKGEGRGRGAFLPRGLKQNHNRSALSKSPGVLGWLSDFIAPSQDEHVRSSVEALLGTVLLVENLPAALTLYEKGIGHTMVTPAGDLVSRDGVIAGGNWDEERGILEMHQEIDDLRETLDANQSKKRDLELKREQMQQQAGLLSSDLHRIGEDLDRESRKTIDHEKDFHRLEEAVRRVRQTVEAAQQERTRLETDRQMIIAEREANRASLPEFETHRAELDVRLKSLTEELSRSRTQLVQQGEILTALRVRQASILERHEAYTRELQSLQAQDETAAQESSNLLESAAKREADAAARAAEIESHAEERQSAIVVHQQQQELNNQLRQAHDEKAMKIQASEADLKKLRENRDSMNEQINHYRLQIREETLKLEHLSSQIFERYAIGLNDVITQPDFAEIKNEVVAEARQELQQLREKMAKIGDVNLAAIEEVRQLQERFAFLTNQKDDLEKSLEALATAIRKINATTRERFITTFEEVSKKFETIFPRLFRGGKGKLVMTDPENILETGIDIVAQPPGKRLQNMNLLSGGEKALTAIALLFAIFEHKAPPFCVLDEVDAPLDEVNVRRFVAMVKEMSLQTQFIVITHNKVTMEGSENLYGVTMEEPGVSRMVSVRVSQMAAKENTETNLEEARSVA